MNPILLYSSLVELDLGTVQPTVSGPKRPQDKIFAKDLAGKFGKLLMDFHQREYIPIDKREVSRWYAEGGQTTKPDAKPTRMPKSKPR
jgi:aconitate hydratase